MDPATSYYYAFSTIAQCAAAVVGSGGANLRSVWGAEFLSSQAYNPAVVVP